MKIRAQQKINDKRTYYRSIIARNFNLTTEELGNYVVQFCRRYLIPQDYFFRIIKDQKVLPMLRGKGMEYSVYLVLKEVLNENEWSVQKLNLSAQPNAPDEDITVTHRRTGLQIKVESKSAVRGSFSLGERSRSFKNIPHFKIKCHRSRSNIKKVGIGNDRYKVTDFDVIISNVENAIYQGNTATEDFELLYDREAIDFLKKYYGVTTQEDLIHATYSDWRFVFPPEIGENDFIPRTPYVKLENDSHWYPINVIEKKLFELVQCKHTKKNRSSK